MSGSSCVNGIPDNLVVNSVISMPEEVPHPPETFPIRPGRNPFGIPTKTNRSLSHNLHLAFNC
jgi:hypothetical protein